MLPLSRVYKLLDRIFLEEEYPYFPREVEEKCLEDANGVPYLYAEAMAKLLFPDTPHLLFKVSYRYLK